MGDGYEGLEYAGATPAPRSRRGAQWQPPRASSSPALDRASWAASRDGVPSMEVDKLLHSAGRPTSSSSAATVRSSRSKPAWSPAGTIPERSDRSVDRFREECKRLRTELADRREETRQLQQRVRLLEGSAQVRMNQLELLVDELRSTTAPSGGKLHGAEQGSGDRRLQELLDRILHEARRTQVVLHVFSDTGERLRAKDRLLEQAQHDREQHVMLKEKLQETQLERQLLAAKVLQNDGQQTSLKHRLQQAHRTVKQQDELLADYEHANHDLCVRVQGLLLQLEDERRARREQELTAQRLARKLEEAHLEREVVAAAAASASACVGEHQHAASSAPPPRLAAVGARAASPVPEGCGRGGSSSRLPSPTPSPQEQAYGDEDVAGAARRHRLEYGRLREEVRAQRRAAVRGPAEAACGGSREAVAANADAAGGGSAAVSPLAAAASSGSSAERTRFPGEPLSAEPALSDSAADDLAVGATLPRWPHAVGGAAGLLRRAEVSRRSGSTRAAGGPLASEPGVSAGLASAATVAAERGVLQEELQAAHGALADHVAQSAQVVETLQQQLVAGELRAWSLTEVVNEVALRADLQQVQLLENEVQLRRALSDADVRCSLMTTVVNQAVSTAVGTSAETAARAVVAELAPALRRWSPAGPMPQEEPRTPVRSKRSGSSVGQSVAGSMRGGGGSSVADDAGGGSGFAVTDVASEGSTPISVL